MTIPAGIIDDLPFLTSLRRDLHAHPELGFVLGPLLEENLRRAMILSRGDPTTFVTRPISAVLLAIALGVLIIVFLPSVKKKREEVFVEET